MGQSPHDAQTVNTPSAIDTQTIPHPGAIDIVSPSSPILLLWFVASIAHSAIFIQIATAIHPISILITRKPILTFIRIKKGSANNSATTMNAARNCADCSPPGNHRLAINAGK